MSNGIHLRENGEVSAYVGASAVNFFRMRMILSGLKSEAHGMRLTRNVSCYKLAKTEYGLKGNLAKVTAQFEQILNSETQKQLATAVREPQIQG